MYKWAIFSRIFIILFGLGQSAEAAMQKMLHDHHAAASSGVCEQTNAGPSLKCARAPSAVFDNDRKLWLTWAFGEHVYVNYSDDRGETYSAPVQVNQVAEDIYAMGENRPKIIVADNGHIYISWTQKLPARFSGHIRFSRSVDGGKSFSEPVIVNDHRAVTSHRFEAMALNERGDIYLAWLDKRDLLAAKKAQQPYKGAALYYAISTDGGVTFNRNEKIIDNTCECCRVAMAIDNDQLPVMLWRHIFGDNVRDHAMVKFTGRNQAGDVVRVSQDQWQIEACPHHGPDISIEEDGRYHLVWFNNAPERHGLFYASTSDQGKTFSTPLNFGNYTAQAAHPQVLSTAKAIHLLWKEFDGKQASLITMKSTDSGRTWSAPRVITKTTAASDHPLLIAEGDKVYGVWHRLGEHYQLFPLED